jgi:hypothetical protein
MEIIQGWYNSFFGNGFVTKRMVKNKITYCNITYYGDDPMEGMKYSDRLYKTKYSNL